MQKIGTPNILIFEQWQFPNEDDIEVYAVICWWNFLTKMPQYEQSPLSSQSDLDRLETRVNGLVKEKGFNPVYMDTVASVSCGRRVWDQRDPDGPLGFQQLRDRLK